MSSADKKLKLDFQGYWHVGSGRGEGYHLDAVCLKDNYGLPYVSGKQLKGLLRHAVRRAEAWGWYKDFVLPTGKRQSFEELLFGSESQDLTRFDTFSGMLFVDNATLSEPEYSFLQQADKVQYRQALYQPLYSTAINPKTGTAVENSLRGIEVTLPCRLYTELTLKISALESELIAQQKAFLESNTAWQIIEKALPLIDAIGAHRTRGLGEVIVTFED